MQACPELSTKRSRSGHSVSAGLVRRNRVKIVYPSGASAIAVPGCPALAFCTEYIARPRMVSIARRLISSGSARPAVGAVALAWRVAAIGPILATWDAKVAHHERAVLR